MNIKIYRTKDGQNFSLKLILMMVGIVQKMNVCDVAGIYAIPEDIKIIVCGRRLRFDGTVYLINDKEKPAVGIYKLKDSALELEKTSKRLIRPRMEIL